LCAAPGCKILTLRHEQTYVLGLALVLCAIETYLDLRTGFLRLCPLSFAAQAAELFAQAAESGPTPEGLGDVDRSQRHLVPLRVQDDGLAAFSDSVAEVCPYSGQGRGAQAPHVQDHHQHAQALEAQVHTGNLETAGAEDAESQEVQQELDEVHV